MRITTNFKMPFRRRREGKTNYRKRLALLKSGKIRLVIRKSNRRILVQFVQFKEDGDHTILSLDSSMLKKNYNYPAKRNTPTAYLLGLLAGKKALEKGIKEAIADICDVPTKGAIVFAVVKGVVDAGVEVPFSAEKVVVDERLLGAHLGDDVKKMTEEVRNKIIG